jgi:DNA-binding CsgD family transcriptional regulator
VDTAKLDELSALIGKIYDVALAPSGWPDVLQGVRAFIDAETVTLNAYDLADKTPPWQYEVGNDPRWMQVYVEKYYAINPYMDDVARLASGEVTVASGRPDFEDLPRSEFYRGWLKPQGFLDASVLVIDKTFSSISTLVSVRHERQGLFDEAEVRRLYELLYPHLRRSVLIGSIIAGQGARLDAFTGVLDALSAGVFLLTDKGEIAHANAAGEAMLAAGAPVKKVGGRLELPAGEAARAFREALASVGAGEAALGGKGAAIPIGASAGHVAHLLPLNGARRKAIEADRSVALILFVKRNDPADAVALAAFARRFGLTPQETRVLQAVVQVGGVPLAADLLGLSVNTVRTHVTAIFDKTGVRRQADLIRIVMEMKSPFAG